MSVHAQGGCLWGPYTFYRMMSRCREGGKALPAKTEILVPAGSGNYGN